MEALHYIVILLLSYLCGSFPTSIVVGKLFFHKDIRNYGSGNAGGTNTVRVFGWKAGILVITVDILKGAIPVIFIAQIPPFDGSVSALFSADAMALSAGIAAVIGHIWTVFASFRGGKGVATAAGMIAALYPLAFGITLLVFVLTVAISRIVSLASMVCAVFFPALLFSLHLSGIYSSTPLLLWISLPIALLILFTHRANIRRLIRGEEKRMFKKGER